MTIFTKKRHRLLVLSGLALVLAVGGAGCGDGDPSASGKPTGTAAAGGERSALAFSRCMRAQGLEWYPDPDAEGNLRAKEPADVDRAAYQQAQKTCEVYAPWGDGAEDRRSAEDLAKLRQVSQCIRDRGFPKFPDPDQGGDVHVDKSSGISLDDPAFRTAQEECQKHGPDGGRE